MQVDAIDIIHAVMASAARGRDPRVVSTSTAGISFVVTNDSWNRLAPKVNWPPR